MSQAFATAGQCVEFANVNSTEQQQRQRAQSTHAGALGKPFVVVDADCFVRTPRLNQENTASNADDRGPTRQSRQTGHNA